MKALFIGLGGAGCSSVAEYARMVKNAGIKTDDAFIYFDTEVAIRENYPIMGNDFFHLGSIAPGSRHTINKLRDDAIRVKDNPNTSELEKKESVQFLDWFDESVRSGEPLEKGAEGVRMMSRAMLYAEYNYIKEIISNKRTYIDDTGDNQDRRIYVVSGTCGGTGAGTVLDILYMIQEILVETQQSNANDPDTNLLLVMPQGYVMGVNNPKNNLYIPYRTNPYALFDEINGCLKDYNSYYSNEDKDESGVKAVSDQDAGKRYYYYRCYGGDTPEFPFTVFQNAYLFDSVDAGTGERLSPRQRCANVSNFLYIMEAASQAQANLNTTVSNQSRLCKFASRNKPFIEAFSGTGLFVAQSWEEFTRKYVHDKALYQLLQFGFLGQKEGYSDECLDKDKKGFLSGINDLISAFDYKTSLDEILQDLSGDDLEKLHKNIKSAIGDKSNRIKDIFVISNKKDQVNELSKGVANLLRKVSAYTYQSCADLMITYNLYHALKVVGDLDVYFDYQYKSLLSSISEDAMDIDWRTKLARKGDHQRRVICSTLLSTYFKYLVYRNLSNDDNGFLDNCKNRIDAAISSIKLQDQNYKVEGVKISDLDSEYRKYLNELKNDINRRIYPDLSTLYNFNASVFVAGNSVERKYANLVAQQNPEVAQGINGGLPDFRTNVIGENNQELGNLLYKHKATCVESLKTNETTWVNYFTIDDNVNAISFAENIKLALASFFKVAQEKADSLSLDPSLSIPFPQLTPEAQANLVNTMQSYQTINLSVNYSRTSNAHTAIVVGDLIKLSWLKNGLFPQVNGQAAYNTMERVEVQSTDMPDRVELLFVRFGYALNDYSFYGTYKGKFEYILAHHRERVNPTYNDKRFWEAKGNLGEFFRAIKELADKNALVTKWRGHYDVLTKFNALFLYNLLESHYKLLESNNAGTIEGLELLEKMKHEDFIKLEQEIVNSDDGKAPEIKIKNIVIFKTQDNVFARERDIYRPEGDGLQVNFSTHYNRVTELRSFASFYEFWVDILRQLGENLDMEAIVQAFNDTKESIGDSYLHERPFIEENIYKKYHKNDEQTHVESIDWLSCFTDFIRICTK